MAVKLLSLSCVESGREAGGGGGAGESERKRKHVARERAREREKEIESTACENKQLLQLPTVPSNSIQAA